MLARNTEEDHIVKSEGSWTATTLLAKAGNGVKVRLDLAIHNSPPQLIQTLKSIRQVLISMGISALAGCAATTSSNFLKPGYSSKVECLSVQYQIGPYDDPLASSLGKELESSLQAITQRLFTYNGMRTCGVARLGQLAFDSRGASHLLVLRSTSGSVRRQYGITLVTFMVDAELLDQRTGEAVFKGRTGVIGGDDVSASKLLAAVANTLAQGGLVSLNDATLRYELDPIRGHRITD